MKPGNDLGRGRAFLFAAVCEFLCELLLVFERLAVLPPQPFHGLYAPRSL